MLDDNLWDGIAEGFPLCCIIWFCDVWNNVRSEHRMFSGRPECYDWQVKGIDHVACPDCIIKRLSQ